MVAILGLILKLREFSWEIKITATMEDWSWKINLAKSTQLENCYKLNSVKVTLAVIRIFKGWLIKLTILSMQVLTQSMMFHLMKTISMIRSSKKYSCNKRNKAYKLVASFLNANHEVVIFWVRWKTRPRNNPSSHRHSNQSLLGDFSIWRIWNSRSRSRRQRQTKNLISRRAKISTNTWTKQGTTSNNTCSTSESWLDKADMWPKALSSLHSTPPTRAKISCNRWALRET